jgi:hypothetical protein
MDRLVVPEAPTAGPEGLNRFVILAMSLTAWSWTGGGGIQGSDGTGLRLSHCREIESLIAAAHGDRKSGTVLQTELDSMIFLLSVPLWLALIIWGISTLARGRCSAGAQDDSADRYGSQWQSCDIHSTR